MSGPAINFVLHSDSTINTVFVAYLEELIPSVNLDDMLISEIDAMTISEIDQTVI